MGMGVYLKLYLYLPVTYDSSHVQAHILRMEMWTLAGGKNMTSSARNPAKTIIIDTEIHASLANVRTFIQTSKQTDGGEQVIGKISQRSLRAEHVLDGF